MLSALCSANLKHGEPIQGCQGVMTIGRVVSSGFDMKEAGLGKSALGCFGHF